MQKTEYKWFWNTVRTFVPLGSIDYNSTACRK